MLPSKCRHISVLLLPHRAVSLVVERNGCVEEEKEEEEHGDECEDVRGAHASILVPLGLCAATD